MSSPKSTEEKIMQILQKEYEKTRIKAKISKLLRKTFCKQYLERKSLPDISASLTFELVSQSCPLFFETGLKHINDQVNKLMEQNIVKKESYDEETILFVIRKKHFLI